MSDANTDRPALSPPAEVRVYHVGAALQGIADTHADVLSPREQKALYLAAASLWDAAPTPTPADHIGDATEMMAVDWQRVGPKLVEALEFYADPGRYDGPNQKNRDDDKWSVGQAYLVDVTRDHGNIARAALAAAQPQSNGE